MPKDSDDAGVGDNSGLEVDYGDLQTILDELAGKKKSVDEAVGSIRNRIGEIVKAETFHKGAFADIRKIDAMSDTGRADYLRTFEALFDVMMERKWRQKVRDLLDAAAEAGMD